MTTFWERGDLVGRFRFLKAPAIPSHTRDLPPKMRTTQSAECSQVRVCTLEMLCEQNKTDMKGHAPPAQVRGGILSFELHILETCVQIRVRCRCLLSASCLEWWIALYSIFSCRQIRCIWRIGSSHDTSARPPVSSGHLCAHLHVLGWHLVQLSLHEFV